MKLKWKLLTISVVVVLLVWGFCAVRLIIGYQRNGEINHLSESPYFEGFFSQLQTEGSIKYFCRKNARMTSCLYIGYATEQHLTDFFKPPLSLQDVDSAIIQYWETRFDIFDVPLEIDIVATDYYKSGYYETDNLKIRILFKQSESMFYLLVNQFTAD